MLDSRVIKKIIYGFLILMFFLFQFSSLISKIGIEFRTIIPAVVSVKEPYLCAFENEKWIAKDIFTVGENIYICLTITTNKPSTDFHFEVYVFN